MIRIEGIDFNDLLHSMEMISTKIEYQKKILNQKYENINEMRSLRASKVEELLREEREYGRLIGNSAMLSQIIELCQKGE